MQGSYLIFLYFFLDFSTKNIIYIIDLAMMDKVFLDPLALQPEAEWKYFL